MFAFFALLNADSKEEKELIYFHFTRFEANNYWPVNYWTNLSHERSKAAQRIFVNILISNCRVIQESLGFL